MYTCMYESHRYFELEGGIGWFGGGADLTPYYLNETEASFFHCIYKNICDKHDPNIHTSVDSDFCSDMDSIYHKCKKWCDDYFYLPAREEHRGKATIRLHYIILLYKVYTV